MVLKNGKHTGIKRKKRRNSHVGIGIIFVSVSQNINYSNNFLFAAQAFANSEKLHTAIEPTTV